MSAGNSASKSSPRTIPPAFSRNTISSPRRKISTSELLTRNFLGSLTAWLFPDLNTRAMAMICLLGIYTGMYIHLQAPIPELWAEQRARSGNVWSDESGKRRSFRAGFNIGRGKIPGFFGLCNDCATAGTCEPCNSLEKMAGAARAEIPGYAIDPDP